MEKKEMKMVASLAPITEDFLEENAQNLTEALFLAELKSRGFCQEMIEEIWTEYHELEKEATIRKREAKWQE